MYISTNSLWKWYVSDSEFREYLREAPLANMRRAQTILQRLTLASRFAYFSSSSEPKLC